MYAILRIFLRLSIILRKNSKNTYLGICEQKVKSFYPKALKGCRGIVFTHGVWMGGQADGRASGGTKFVRAYLRKRKV